MLSSDLLIIKVEHNAGFPVGEMCVGCTQMLTKSAYLLYRYNGCKTEQHPVTAELELEGGWVVCIALDSEDHD